MDYNHHQYMETMLPRGAEPCWHLPSPDGMETRAAIARGVRILEISGGWNRRHRRLLRQLAERLDPSGAVPRAGWSHSRAVTMAVCRLLYLRTRDPVIEHVCEILLAEGGGSVSREPLAPALWLGWMRFGPSLRAVGSSRGELLRQVRQEAAGPGRAPRWLSGAMAEAA